MKVAEIQSIKKMPRFDAYEYAEEAQRKFEWLKEMGYVRKFI